MSVIGYYSSDAREDFTLSVRDALIARSLGRPMPPGAALYADEPLLPTLAYSRLRATGRDRGVDPRQRGEVVRLALTSSDFAFWTGGTVGKVVLEHYQNSAPAYRRLLARRDFSTFAPTHVMAAADFPLPLETAEAGEAQAGAILEGGEIGTLATYRRRVILTRRLLIDDDGGAFADLARAAALRSVDLEESLFFATLTSGSGANGPTLRDGGQYFATSRGNLAASGAAISATTISAARAAVMSAASPSGVKSVATPRFLVVPPALLTLAETELAKLNPGSDPSMRITPIGSPHLSGTAWYLFADPRQRPAYVYSYLAGSPGPIVTASHHFESEGIEIALSLDFAVTPAEPGAAYKDPGA
jgi:hypothetical protein